MNRETIQSSNFPGTFSDDIGNKRGTVRSSQPCVCAVSTYGWCFSSCSSLLAHCKFSNAASSLCNCALRAAKLQCVRVFPFFVVAENRRQAKLWPFCAHMLDRVYVCVCFWKWAWISQLLESSTIFLFLRAAAVSVSVGSTTYRPWLWLVHCITWGCPVTMLVVLTIPGLSARIVLVAHMPVPRHRRESCFYVFYTILMILYSLYSINSNFVICNDLR